MYGRTCEKGIYATQLWVTTSILAAVILTGCTNSATGPSGDHTEKPGHPSASSLVIPHFGAASLPTLAKAKTSEDQTPGFGLLKKYVTEHSDAPYLAVAGGWNAERDGYDYQSISLTFDNHAVNTAHGTYAYYDYELTDNYRQSAAGGGSSNPRIKTGRRAHAQVVAGPGSCCKSGIRAEPRVD